MGATTRCSRRTCRVAFNTPEGKTGDHKRTYSRRHALSFVGRLSARSQLVTSFNVSLHPRSTVDATIVLHAPDHHTVRRRTWIIGGIGHRLPRAKASCEQRPATLSEPCVTPLK